jgi:hypothetical protein
VLEREAIHANLPQAAKRNDAESVGRCHRPEHYAKTSQYIPELRLIRLAPRTRG